MKKILIIDDDKKMCKELSEILCDEGYAVDSVCNGIEGNNAVSGGGYSLVLLDLKLPGLNGIEILENAKRTMPGLKIIVLTGMPLIREPNEGILSLGEEEKQILEKADFVMNKPFDVEEILGRIGSLTDT